MNRGVTTLEIVIIVVISTMIFGIIFYSFKNLNNSHVLDKEAMNAVSTLNQARSQTLSSKSSNQYGVHIEASRLVVFKGTTYSANDPSNLAVSLNPAVGISNISLTGGATDVVFDRLSGTTSQTGNFRIYLIASSSQYKTVNIYSTGLVESI